MALTDSTTSTTMLVQPSTYGMCNGNNSGLFGGGNDWLGILFLIALCNGGWGGFGGFNGGFGAGSQGVADNYVLTSDFSQLSKQVSDSYSMTERKLDGITNGLCDGFYTQAQLINGVNSNLASAQYNVTNAITTGGYETRNAINSIGNQMSTQYSNMRYDSAMNANNINQSISNGFCQTNYNNSNNTRDIITSQHSDADRIIARLDAIENARQAERIAQLQSENEGLRFAASQERQNAYLVSQLGQKCPQPAYVVQPPTSVTFPNACGCCNG